MRRNRDNVWDPPGFEHGTAASIGEDATPTAKSVNINNISPQSRTLKRNTSNIESRVGTSAIMEREQSKQTPTDGTLIFVSPKIDLF